MIVNKSGNVKVPSPLTINMCFEESELDIKLV